MAYLDLVECPDREAAEGIMSAVQAEHGGTVCWREIRPNPINRLRRIGGYIREGLQCTLVTYPAPAEQYTL